MDDPADELERLRSLLSRLIDAYIVTSHRPDCLPAHRFRAVTRHGIDRWCETRDEAVASILRAAGIEADTSPSNIQHTSYKGD